MNYTSSHNITSSTVKVLGVEKLSAKYCSLMNKFQGRAQTDGITSFCVLFI